jgi:hypothetical protein
MAQVYQVPPALIKSTPHEELGYPGTTKPFAEGKKNEGSILLHDFNDHINPMDPIVVPLLVDAFLVEVIFDLH